MAKRQIVRSDTDGGDVTTRFRSGAVLIGLFGVAGSAHAESGRLVLPTPGIGGPLVPGTDRIGGVPRPGDLDVELSRNPPGVSVPPPPISSGASPGTEPPSDVIQPGGMPGSGGRARGGKVRPRAQNERQAAPASASDDLGIADPFAAASATGGPEAGPAPAGEAEPAR